MILISASKARGTPILKFFRFLISSAALALQNFPLPFSAKTQKLCEQSTPRAELCGMRWVASVSGARLFWAAWVDAPSKCERIAAAPASESALSRAWLRCLYTNTSSMGNKQEELETCMGVIPLASRSRGGVAALAGVREWKAVVGFSGEAGQGGQGAEVGPEEYGGIVQTAGDEVKKAKGQLELSVARDVKDNRKGFCRCAANKRKSRDNEGPL